MTMVSRTGHFSRSLPPDPPAAGRGSGGLLLAIGYLGVLCLGLLPPLAVFLVTRRDPFLRQHAVQALNTALTWLIYLVCAVIAGGVLAMDSITVALTVMIPVIAAGWVVLAVLLAGAANVARRGGFRELPAWACAALVRLGRGSRRRLAAGPDGSAPGGRLRTRPDRSRGCSAGLRGRVPGRWRAGSHHASVPQQPRRLG